MYTNTFDRKTHRESNVNNASIQYSHDSATGMSFPDEKVKQLVDQVRNQDPTKLGFMNDDNDENDSYLDSSENESFMDRSGSFNFDIPDRTVEVPAYTNPSVTQETIQKPEEVQVSGRMGHGNTK